MNDKIRGIPGAWKKQIETFKQLRKISNVETVIDMTLSPDNCDKFKETYVSLKEAIPSFSLNDFHISLLNFPGLILITWDSRTFTEIALKSTPKPFRTCLRLRVSIDV